MTATPQSRTPRHPVRVVTERTGLSPDVLRAWERRYRLVRPGRSAAGHRLYSDVDIERLALVHRAAQGGRSVAQVAGLPVPELARLVAEDAEGRAGSPDPGADLRAEALERVLDLDPERLEAVLRRAVLSLGVPAFLESVLSPLLVRVGDLWHAGEIGVAHEHAAAAVARNVLGWLLAELDADAGARTVLLATPDGEAHRLGAMMAAVLAAHDGWRVVWLGPDVPAGQIAEAARKHAVEAVGLSVVMLGRAAAQKAVLRRVRRLLDRRTTLAVGGAAVRRLGAPGAGITPVRDLAHWRVLLRTLAPARPPRRPEVS